jgi:hypothetical protein
MAFNLDKNLKKLSHFLNEDTFKFVAEQITTFSPNQQKIFVGYFVVYIQLLSEPFNNKNVGGISLCLSYIRSHICKKNIYESARCRFLSFFKVINHLVNKGSFEGSISLSKHILLDDYENYKAEIIPEEILKKIKLSPLELLNSTLNISCSPEISKCIKEYLNLFKIETRRLQTRPLLVFLSQISEIDLKWYKNSGIIQHELKKYNDRLNTRDIKSYPTSRSQYVSVRNAFLILKEHGLLPKHTHLPNFKPKPRQKHTSRRSSEQRMGTLKNNLTYLASIFDVDIYRPLVEYINSLTKSAQPKLVNDLVVYTKLLCSPLNSKDASKTSINLKYIAIHICQRLSFTFAKVRLSYLCKLINYLEGIGLFDAPILLPSVIKSNIEYEYYKAEAIPNITLNKIMLSPLELLESTLCSCSTPKISKCLKDYVDSFTVRKRFKHRLDFPDFTRQFVIQKNTLPQT